MQFNATTYRPLNTPIHRLDARVKIALVVVYSAALFFVDTWLGMAAFALMLAAMALVGRLDVARIAQQLVPVWAIVFVTIAANAFVFDVSVPAVSLGYQAPAWMEGLAPLPLVGNFGISPAGLSRGCFFAFRIILLVGVSLVLTTTTSSTHISQALESFLSPLGKVGVPVRDVATIVSLAMRFIPVTIDEFHRVCMAHKARCAPLDAHKLLDKLRAWAAVFVPVLVALYRRADRLAHALEARCYGAGRATRLNENRMHAGSVATLVACTGACIAIACML